MLKEKLVIDTEHYLKNQAGLGNYKYNLCGIPQKMLKLFINLTFVRADFNYYLHFGRYWDWLGSIIYGLAKTAAGLVLTPRQLVVLRGLVLRRQLLREKPSDEPFLANAS